MATPDKAQRQRKTPRQRAEEALAVAERRLANLTKQDEHLTAKLTAVQREIVQVKARRDYLAQSPDLPQESAAGAP